MELVARSFKIITQQFTTEKDLQIDSWQIIKHITYYGTYDIDIVMVFFSFMSSRSILKLKRNFPINILGVLL